MSSGWKIEFSAAARRALKQLDHKAAARIVAYLDERVGASGNPRALGKPLTGSRLGGLWRYRVGYYRVIADLQDNTLTVLVVRIAHRRQVYR